MSLLYKSLPGAIGVEILGVDLANDDSDATLREIVSIFHRNQFIVIRNQNIDLDGFDRLSKAFGKQRPHFLDHLRMDDQPAILMLSNIYEGERQIGVYDGACFWHTDVAYEDPPNSATIVYSIKTPTQGEAPTYIADMFAAYDALPEKMKQRIDSLTVLHHYGNRYDTEEGSITAAETLTDDQKSRVENIYHPLVKRHPITGRRSLYGVAGSSFGIVGMPDDEALALLHELAEHATQPQFTTAYNYAEGDVAAWDTYSTLHKAPVQTAAKPDDPHARMLWRVSVTGFSRLSTPHVDYDESAAPIHAAQA